MSESNTQTAQPDRSRPGPRRGVQKIPVAFRLDPDLYEFYERLARNDRRARATEPMKLALEDQARALGFVRPEAEAQAA